MTKCITPALNRPNASVFHLDAVEVQRFLRRSLCRFTDDYLNLSVYRVGNVSGITALAFEVRSAIPRLTAPHHPHLRSCSCISLVRVIRP